MDVILVPGLWLDAASWAAVTPALERAGFRPRPLTMPGVGRPAAESSGVGISDWVDAVVSEIDRTEGPVALVGHSGGGNVVYGAADARPDRVTRIVYVDTFPPADGGSIWEFPVVDGVIPFPGWDFFEEAEVADLDAQTRAEAASQAASVPERVPTDPLHLGDERRRGIPATMLTGTMSAEDIRGIIASGQPWAIELASASDLEIVEIHSGHWPQFSQPELLGASIVTALQH